MDYWDTAVEVNRLVCEPEKNWSDVSGTHDFPLQRRVAPTVNYQLDLFGGHVYNVFDPNTFR